MMAVKTPTSLGSIARSAATAGIMTPSARTQSEIMIWMASMLATGTIARFTAGAWRLHPEQVGLVEDGVTQNADRGHVDHYAVDVDGAQPLGLGLGIGLLELAGAGHVLGLGRVDLQRMLDLRGMDRPLADAAQDHRAAALLSIGLGVLEVGERAVDRVDAGGAAGHHQPEAGVVPDVAGIAVGLADILVGDAHRGGEVAHAEHQALQARRRPGDGVDILHALDLLDQRFEADAVLELQL